MPYCLIILLLLIAGCSSTPENEAEVQAEWWATEVSQDYSRIKLDINPKDTSDQMKIHGLAYPGLSIGDTLPFDFLSQSFYNYYGQQVGLQQLFADLHPEGVLIFFNLSSTCPASMRQLLAMGDIILDKKIDGGFQYRIVPVYTSPPHPTSEASPQFYFNYKPRNRPEFTLSEELPKSMKDRLFAARAMTKHLDKFGLTDTTFLNSILLDSPNNHFLTRVNSGPAGMSVFSRQGVLVYRDNFVKLKRLAARKN